LASSSVDVVYIAVPHNLHEEIYIATINSGKDFLGEKPFGIDLAAAEKIAAALAGKSNFVRVSSELPFYPGAQAAVREVQSGNLGEIVEVRSGLLHSSDIDRKKKINWKRQRKFCGDIGVLGDLGMHAAHIPLRLGYKPTRVFAILDDIASLMDDVAITATLATKKTAGILGDDLAVNAEKSTSPFVVNGVTIATPVPVKFVA
jgi:predicted dehydrogenase